MKWEVLKKEPKVSTTFVGSIDVSYKELVSKFGKSMGPSSDHKVREQWFIKLGETFAAVYDWKTSGPISKVVTWNIAENYLGKQPVASIYIHAIMGKTHEAIKKVFSETGY